MAKGRNLSSAQRGIAFSCTAAFLVSELILMVGAGHYIQRKNNAQSLTAFTIQQLTHFVAEFTGTAGTLVFAIGFVAAALSSQLATPLGATATAESIFFMPDAEMDIKDNEEKVTEQDKKRKRKLKIMKQSSNFVMVAIATVVISLNGMSAILYLTLTTIFQLTGYL